MIEITDKMKCMSIFAFMHAIDDHDLYCINFAIYPDVIVDRIRYEYNIDEEKLYWYPVGKNQYSDDPECKTAYWHELPDDLPWDKILQQLSISFNEWIEEIKKDMNDFINITIAMLDGKIVQDYGGQYTIEEFKKKGEFWTE
jgi:hypothetical protein